MLSYKEASTVLSKFKTSNRKSIEQVLKELGFPNNPQIGDLKSGDKFKWPEGSRRTKGECMVIDPQHFFLQTRNSLNGFDDKSILWTCIKTTDLTKVGTLYWSEPTAMVKVVK